MTQEAQVQSGQVNQVLAHAFGQVSVCSTGDSLISCSDDSFVHMYTGVSAHKFELDNATRQSIELDSYATCVDAYKQTIAYGCEDYQVCLVNSASLQESKIILRCTLPVRCCKFSPNGEHLIVGADDMSLIQYNVKIDSVHKLTGLSKSVISLAFHPNSQLFACACCDGSIKIFNLKDGGSVVHSTPNLFKAIEPESDIVKIDWSQDGKTIAVPSARSVVLLDAQQQFKVKKTIKNLFKSEVSVVKFSTKDHSVLACGDEQGNVLIINVDTEQDVNKFEGEMKICDITWMNSDQNIIFADSMGQLSCWKNAHSLQLSKNVSLVNSNLEVNNSTKEDIQQHSQTINDTQMKDSVLSDLESDAFDGLSQLDDLSQHEEEEDDLNRQPFRVQSNSVRSFQPGSTPFKDGKRYMAFNTVGVIDSVQSDEYQSITIEFHDLTQRPINFKAIYPFSMASLSENAAVFAANRISQDEAGCVIYYKPFENWSQNAEWTLYLSADEKIECIALGDFVVIATDKYLRVLTCSGLERFIFCVPGQVVSMAMTRSDLMLIYYDGSYKCLLKNLDNQSSLTVEVPVKSELTWTGFSSSSIVPGVYGQDGLFMAFIVKYMQWCPLLDSSIYSKGKTDFYWPIAFDDKSLSVVICKGGDKQPRFPKPIVSELEFKLPLINLDSSAFEQQYLLNAIQFDDQCEDVHVITAEMDKSLLQMLQVAAKAKKMNRCLDICQLLVLPKSLEIAFKLCQKLNLTQVCAKIEQIISQKKLLIEKEEQQEEFQVPSVAPPQIVQERFPNEVQHQSYENKDEIQQQKQKLQPAITPRKQVNQKELFMSPAVIPSDQLIDRIAPPNPFKRKQESSPVGQKQTSGNYNVFSNVFNKQPPQQQTKTKAKKETDVSNNNTENAKKRKVAAQQTLSFSMHSVKNQSVADDSVKPHVSNEVVGVVLPDLENSQNSQNESVKE